MLFSSCIATTRPQRQLCKTDSLWKHAYSCHKITIYFVCVSRKVSSETVHRKHIY